jgi:pentatricopeptide repeat protein
MDHYTFIVDLLGHAGHLQEAEDMIKAMRRQPYVEDFAQRLQNSW